ncbi:MAG: flagellar export protein FliJ [Fidelibacterota bacterium]
MSKSDQFSLEKVLNVKSLREELLEIDLRKTKDELKEAQRRLSKLENVKDSALLHHAKPETTHSLFDLQVSAGYINGLNATIADQRKKTSASTVKVANKRRELLAAAKAKKVLEKLKEKYLERQAREAKKAEQKKQDEQAITAAGRNVGGGRIG